MKSLAIKIYTRLWITLENSISVCIPAKGGLDMREIFALPTVALAHQKQNRGALHYFLPECKLANFAHVNAVMLQKNKKPVLHRLAVT
jgi:hypothetical protein